MLYKTMTLELLQEGFPTLHEKLRQRRALLQALDRYSLYFKASHDSRNEELLRIRPRSYPDQIASEALEIAIEDLREKLSADELHVLT